MAKFVTTASMTHVSGDSVLNVTSSTTNRPIITEILLSSSSTPADTRVLWVGDRTTTTGTGTSTTPRPLDTDGVAAQATARHTLTAEPTYSSTPVFRVAHNLQATFRWVVDEANGIVLPATANNGVGFLPTVSGGTPVLDMQVSHTE